VTFLLTDVEASSAEWDADADQMDEWLRDLEARIESAVGANGGVVIKTRGEGDSAFAVFDRASSALVAAHELQLALASQKALAVRGAIHSGEARLRDGDYFGSTPNRTARLRSLAHGGQTIVSRVAADLAEPELAGPLSLFRLGSYRVKDWPRDVQIFELRGPGLRTDFPPLRVWGDTQRAVKTMVHVDAVGSSKAAAAMGEEAAVDMHRALARFLREACNRYSASFFKFLGDGCLAAFDDPEKALRFARTAAASERPLRVAMHAGVIELVGDDVMGQPLYRIVHVGARARAGEIVATGIVADLLRGPSVEFERKGDDDDVFVVRS
jgi:class 3 adenylate cyclase